jgi:Pyruvate/2-oxoacid:ferredoxin oxidoreductase gamma subunit
MTDTIDRPAADGEHVLDHLIIRFAGDSGDGMQLTGDRFTSVSASFGNDLSTLPDFPAEIRAPAGTVNGVSAFQVNIADHKITTPGDEPNVLVAMNPAALMADLHRLEPGGTVIVNEDAFEERNLEKAGYKVNPLDDDTLSNYRVLRVPMTSLTKEICAPLGVKPRDAERSKNFFALGLVSFMYTRPVDPTLDWIADKFGGNELVEAANKASFLAGFNFGETTEAVGHRYEVKPAKLPAGEYTSITGNTALAWGIVAAGQLAKLPITLGSYPITPASDILHELSKHKHFGIRTVQAEDEIAAIGMALGAAFAGHLGVTTTSGPGVALKSETTSLAVSIELPLLIVDIQRGGPSTGLPTKTEASDLNIALYGRHGEAPLPDRCRLHPSAVLPRCDRGGPHRTQVPHPGDTALRRLSRQRLRAVEPAVGRVAARHLRAVHDCAEPRRRRRQRGLLAVSARRDHAGSPVGDPRHTGPDAPGRRPREEGRHGQHRLHAREPRAHGAPACRQDRRHRRRHPADGDQRRCRRRRPRARLGFDVGSDRCVDPTKPPSRQERRIGAHHAPQSVAAQISVTS